MDNSKQNEPLGVTQAEGPCVLHNYHSPVTVINERHHPFPQEWQKKIWGEVRDNRTVSICATSHNTVHYAISIFERTGEMPGWCVGKTRDLAESAIRLRDEALAGG